MQSAKLFRLRLSSKYRPDASGAPNEELATGRDDSSMAPPASRPKPRPAPAPGSSANSSINGAVDVPDGLEFDTTGMFGKSGASDMDNY
jgi:hypothetical protein